MLSEPTLKSLRADLDGRAFAARVLRNADGRASRESAVE